WGFGGRSWIDRTLQSHLKVDRDPVLSTFGNQTDLIDWIKTQTQKDEAVLAPIGLSPVILAYTGRPIVLHSKFESKILRDKFENFVMSLFSSEDQFLEFYKQSEASYF